jgi:hypothetical protein
MKWTVKLVAEVVESKRIKHEIATIERTDETSHPTTLHALPLYSIRKDDNDSRVCPACYEGDGIEKQDQQQPLETPAL